MQMQELKEAARLGDIMRRADQFHRYYVNLKKAFKQMHERKLRSYRFEVRDIKLRNRVVTDNIIVEMTRGYVNCEIYIYIK